MKTLKESIQRTVNKFRKIPPHATERIIEEYQKSMLDTLIDNGHVYITPEIRIEVVPITPRRYVLRGAEYHSVRLYKLKATISEDSVYERISGAYDALREDLE